MSLSKKLILLGVALGLTGLVCGAVFICREDDCIKRLKEDVKTALQPDPTVLVEPPAPLPPAPTAARTEAEEPTAADPVSQPVAARPCPGAEVPMSCYGRRTDLKRRFAEGAILTRVSRPRPAVRMQLRVPESEVETVWVSDAMAGFGARRPVLGRRVPSWGAPPAAAEALPDDLGQVPAFESLLPE